MSYKREWGYCLVDRKILNRPSKQAEKEKVWLFSRSENFQAKGTMGSERIGGRGRESVQGLPAATKKVVQSLKEIVNCSDCTDQEIYAVLEECNMDPDRAVERLLAQGFVCSLL